MSYYGRDGIVSLTGYQLVKSPVEGAKRKLARPVQPKKPLSAHTVQASAEVSVTSNPLSDVRFLFILLDSLSLKDVAIKGDHMTIYVAKCKND